MESSPVDNDSEQVAIGIPLDTSETSESKVKPLIIQNSEGLTIEIAQEYAMPGLSECRK